LTGSQTARVNLAETPASLQLRNDSRMARTRGEMITPLHNKDGFFKYYTAASAELTLKHTSRKWSTPALFNDPFDNQFDLHLEEPTETLVDENLTQFHELIHSPHPLRPNQLGAMTPVAEYIRQIYQQNPDFKYTDEHLAYLRGGVVEGMQRAIEINPGINAEIRSAMADTSIFCLSETHDNLLMWSHYAQNHTGAVIKFLSLPQVDSPLILAQPVRYTAQIPRREFASMMDFQKSLTDTIEQITLTKSDVWAYEREWRIVAGLRDKTQTYEILRFVPEEVGEVYLGCKIANDDQEKIVELTRSLYPAARIFQAEKHPREFALVFGEVS
jgi:hypothetical protein